jgi:hypothetical protein
MDLNTLLEGEFLFPSLSRLNLRVADERHISVIASLFFSSSLRKITIGEEVNSPTPLLLASKFTPRITTLLVHIPEPHETEVSERLSIKAILMQAMAFKHLQTLKLVSPQYKETEVDSAVLYRLIRALPLLKDLPVEWVTPIGGHAIEPLTFPRLESFALHYAPHPATGENEVELEPISLVKLVTDLFIYLPPIVTPTSVARFMFAASRSPHKLKEVTVTCQGPDEFDLSIFLPVLSSKNLQYLHISDLNLVHKPPHNSRSNFSDLIITAIHHDVDGHPRNNAHFIDLCLHSRTTPQPTLRDLQIFAERLPHLRELTMPIDLQDQSSPTLLNDVRFENSLEGFSLHTPDALWGEDSNGGPLKRLPLSDRDYLPLAQRLNAWFPNLEELCSCDHPQQWALVEEMRKMIQKIEKRFETPVTS